MAKYPYRDLGVGFDRTFRNDLNSNFDDVESDIFKVQTDIDTHIASATAHAAEKITYTGSVTGNNVKAALDEVDSRIDNIVAGAGNSNAEIVDARYDSINNVTHATLKDRLDSDSNKIGVSLAEIETLKTGKADKTEVNSLATAKADKTYVDTELTKKANQTDLTTTNNTVNLKADKSYVDTQIQSVASGSPKGVYATLTDLQTAFPNGNSNIYVVTADGKWYYWNGSVWVAGGVYQATAISEKAVTPEKTNFINIGKNLFDKNKINSAQALNSSGQLTANATYNTSDYIAVTASAIYTRSHRNIMSFYDANKTFISNVSGNSPSDVPETFTTPANAAFVRISMNTSYTDSFQLELGSSATSYESFKLLAPKVEMQRSNFQANMLSDLDSIQTVRTTVERLASYEDVFINEVATSSAGDSVNNTSTFSGWGSPVGIKKDFDTVSLFVTQWDATKPITKIRVIVKENNYSGAVLGDGTFDVSLVQGQLTKLTLRLSSVISNASDVPLWVEFHTNGRTGVVKTSEATYLPPTYPAVKYSTKSSVTDLTMTDVSTANYNTYFEFKKHNGNKIIPTQEFTDNLSLSVTKTDHYGKFFLRNWQSQASKYTDPTFNERLELMLLGDSWVQGKFRLAEPLRNKLKAIHGDAGIGFIGFANSHYGNGNVTVTLAGTWTQIDAHTGASSSKGLDIAHAESNTVGSTATVTISEGSTYFRIEHIQQTGSYRYQVDGGTWITVDNLLVDSVEITGLTDTGHTIIIEVLSGTVTLTGAYSYKGTKGVVVHKAGNGGLTAAQLLQSDETNYVSQLAKSNAHTVGILLGTNDMSANVSVTTFKSQITSIIDRVRSALPSSDVFLIAPSGNNLTGRLHTMQEYSDALLEVAKTERVGFVSLYENIGDYEEANSRGLYGDGVHPNTQGGYVIANAIYDRLLRVG